jgi:predicted nucleic acid-binding protein
VIVVDAGVALDALTRDDDVGARARSRIEEGPLAPELIGIEVVSALRKLAAAKIIQSARAELAVTDFTDLPFVLTPHWPLLARCWELRDNLTTYDAAYVALAELFEARLVTADRRLASAPGIRCEVEVLD